MENFGWNRTNRGPVHRIAATVIAATMLGAVVTVHLLFGLFVNSFMLP